MRSIGNYYSEWADTRGTRHTLLVTLIACAVGATASAAVIFSLASSPTTNVPTISPQAIVRNTGTSEVPKTAQDGPVESTSRPAANSMTSGLDEPVTQNLAEHQTEAQSHQSRKHGRVVRRWHEPYWRRFAHNSSPRPFGFW